MLSSSLLARDADISIFGHLYYMLGTLQAAACEAPFAIAQKHRLSISQLEHSVIQPKPMCSLHGWSYRQS